MLRAGRGADSIDNKKATWRAETAPTGFWIITLRNEWKYPESVLCRKLTPTRLVRSHWRSKGGVRKENGNTEAVEQGAPHEQAAFRTRRSTATLSWKPVLHDSLNLSTPHHSPNHSGPKFVPCFNSSCFLIFDSQHTKISPLFFNIYLFYFLSHILLASFK